MFTNNAALPLNFGTTIASTRVMAAEAFGCKSNVTCTEEELFAIRRRHGLLPFWCALVHKVQYFKEVKRCVLNVPLAPR